MSVQQNESGTVKEMILIRMIPLTIVLFILCIDADHAAVITVNPGATSNIALGGTRSCKNVCLNVLLRCMTTYMRIIKKPWARCYQTQRYCLQTCSILFKS